MTQPRHQDTRLILAVYAVALGLSLLFSFFTGNPSPITGAHAVIESNAFTPPITFRNLERGAPDRMTHEARVPRSAFAGAAAASGEGIGLLVSRFASNGYRVWWNGVPIGGQGSLTDARANLWNDCAFYPIPDTLLADENVLVMESRTWNKTGLADEPIRIVGSRDGFRYVGLFRFFNHTVLLIGIGILMASIVILLLMGILSDSHRMLYVLLAAGTLSIGLYAMDYTPFLALPISYDAYKRAVMVCLGSTGLFYGLAVHRQLRFAPAAWLGVAGWIGIVLLALLAPDLIAFRQGYALWYLSQIANIAVWIVAAARVYRRQVEARIYLLGFAVLGLHALINFVIDRTGLFFSMNSPLVYVAVFSIIPLMLIYFDFLIRKRQLAHESA